MMIIGEGESPANARKARRHEKLRTEVPSHSNDAHKQSCDLGDHRYNESWQ